MILLIDNYDSFVYNLARYLTRLGVEVLVRRNDAVDVESIRQLNPRGILLSPGPCSPLEAGCCLEVVRQLYREAPILGVCLGHQAIAQALGGRIVRAVAPVHGRASQIEHDGRGVFAGLSEMFTVGRYHSLVVERQSLPYELEVSAVTADGTVMALRHREYPVVGMQFHPESILTEHGYELLANFCRLAGISICGEVPRTALELPLVVLPRLLPDRPVTF
ncbi:MAG: aminodeoxychorismate/anthranilate synthase component II [Pirellulales bacterium]